MLPENVLQKLLGDVSFSDRSKDISEKRENAKKKKIFSVHHEMKLDIAAVHLTS